MFFDNNNIKSIYYSIKKTDKQIIYIYLYIYIVSLVLMPILVFNVPNFFYERHKTENVAYFSVYKLHCCNFVPNVHFQFAIRFSLGMRLRQ